MSNRSRLVWRTTQVAVAVTATDLVVRTLVTATLKLHQHVSLWAGVSVVHQQRQSGWFAPATVVALGAALLVLLAGRAGVAQRTLWLPAGLLLGAGVASAVDLALDGRITRWFDPPLWSAVSSVDIALAAGLLGLVYALGEALGGAEPPPSVPALR